MSGANDPLRNAELEAAILETPESADAYLVYGDWLLEHGDALGELVTVQATLAKLQKRAGKAKEKSALGKREKLLRKEAEARLGDLIGYEHTWSFGFLESLIVPEPTSTSYAAILAAPAARFLRELDIDEISFTAPRGGIHPTIAMLTRLGVPAALRKLALLAEVFDPIRLGPIPPDLWSRLAAIEELTIRVAEVEPGKIVLPRLTTLALATALTDAVLTAVAEAECPRLTSVQLDSVTQDVAVSAARMQPLFSHWAMAGTLRHLGVTEHDAGNELVAAVRATGLVTQLTSLDLSRTHMTDEGAAAILENAAAFEHLESFNLAENDLSPSMTRNLEKRFDLAVDVEAQGMRYEPIEE